MFLKLQKRLAAAVLNCGKNRVHLDPTEAPEIAVATSRSAIRKLVKNNVISKKPVAISSHARHRRVAEAKRKGRHSGVGKRKGSCEARMPTKVMWVRRQRVLRRLLRKYREAAKIDKHIYREFYVRAKGNQYKNKRVLIEAIHRAKNEKIKVAAQLAEQQRRKDAARRRKDTRKDKTVAQE